MASAKAKGLLWALAGIGVAVCLAVGLPALAKRVPWSAERWLDRTVGVDSLARPCGASARPESRAALQRLVARLYPLYPDDRTLPITVDVLPGDTVNAYAGLGGHVHVFDGLLRKAETPEELAGVLAHEIEHVRGRHVMQGLATRLFTLATMSAGLPSDSPVGSRLAYTLLNLKFDRAQESEADEEGLKRLKAAGVGAEGLERFFARAEQGGAAPQWLSSHPANDVRAALAHGARGYPTTPVLSAADWRELGAICHPQ